MHLNMKKGFIPALLLVMGSLGFMTSCSSFSKEGFDNTTYDISTANDNSVEAALTKIDGGYKLSISGTGAVKDFSEENKVPWYSIARKVQEVSIAEGITGLGTEVFSKVRLTYYFSPASLVTFTDTTFPLETLIYSYASDVQNAENYNMYYYSETTPTNEEAQTKNYWHMVDNKPLAWIVETIKALFVGNSFTFYNDIPALTQSIATDIGYDLICESVTVGSHTLEQYANEADDYGKQVYEKLRAHNDYDYMILQEQSTRSYTNYASFKNGATVLKNLADATQTKCQTRLYATWGFAEEAALLNGTIPEMEGKVREAYETLARELNVKVHQVGQAFSKTYTEHSEINLYHTDAKHPSYAGSYLSSLIHVGSIFGCDVRLTNYHGDLDEATANVLKEVAYAVLFN